MQKSINSHNLTHYRIELKGHLDKKWSDWLSGLTIKHTGDNTILEGPVADQAALYGILLQLRDLNLPLLSVYCLRPKESIIHNF